MSPQKENGFTPIANELFEAFYRCKLLEYERVIMMCIWRKTYGWSKKEDWIANSQFHEETGIPKPHITRTLKSLREKGIITKDKKKVTINKNYSVWQVEWRVTSPGNRVTSPGNKKLPHQVPTKESKANSTKTIRSEGVDKQNTNKKETAIVEDMTKHNPQGAEVIFELIKVDPKNKTYYNNSTQRSACDFLLAEYGLDEIKKRTDILSKTNAMPYFPNITTPCQLRDKWVSLNNQIERYRTEQGAKASQIAF
jgi:phage replication O-like protein O